MTTPIIIHINADNKAYYARKFANSLISKMDPIEIKNAIREYLYRDKMKEPASILEQEISKSFPELLQYPELHLEQEIYNAKSIS